MGLMNALSKTGSKIAESWHNDNLRNAALRKAKIGAGAGAVLGGINSASQDDNILSGAFHGAVTGSVIGAGIGTYELAKGGSVAKRMMDKAKGNVKKAEEVAEEVTKSTT